MDELLCRFLGTQYGEVKGQVVEGKSDAEILVWCQETGGLRSEYDVLLFNKFLQKLGWRDEDYGKRLRKS